MRFEAIEQHGDVEAFLLVVVPWDAQHLQCIPPRSHPPQHPSRSSHDNAVQPNQLGLNHSMLIARVRNFASAGMPDAWSEAIHNLDSIFGVFLPHVAA